jgi:YcaO cyclodehydratase, ATP-ad Mg2+-binding
MPRKKVARFEWHKSAAKTARNELPDFMKALEPDEPSDFMKARPWAWDWKASVLMTLSGWFPTTMKGSPSFRSNPTLTRFPDDRKSALSQLVDQLQERGIATYAIDLTRHHFETPVARVMAPGLQLEPSAVVGPRLAQVIHETGGGVSYNGGIPLL